MSKHRILAFIALAACAAHASAGDVVVIVNKANDNAVDKALIVKIYTGESKAWAGGGTIVAYDLAEDNPSRASFDTDTIGKSQASLKTLWTQNTFTGKAVPPKLLASDEEVKKAISANKNAIGYIKASAVDDSVKVVAK